MLKDITKKLTMKKSFFVTQLEGFFNAISQEYQDLIRQKEVENSLLQEKLAKLENDIANLVRIRDDLNRSLAEKEEEIAYLHRQLDAKHDDDATLKKLLQENRRLKEELKKSSTEEVEALKAKLEKLQKIVAGAGSSYQESLDSQSREALIEEISKSLKK